MCCYIVVVHIVVQFHRLQHKLVVCGSAGSGKRSLKNNWSMTTWSTVVEKIADVDIITCQVLPVCTCVRVYSLNVVCIIQYVIGLGGI